ncbi:MAG: beta-ketoacyl-ACP synthase II [Euzebya sp.]
MLPPLVAITGLGAVSPHGVGVEALWEGLLAGRSTAAPITAYDATGFGVRFACEVPVSVQELLPRKLVRQTDRFAHLALVAAEEAVVQAGLCQAHDEPVMRSSLQQVDPDRVGAIIASGAGGIGEITQQHQRLLEQGPSRVRPYLAIAMPLNMAAGQIAIRHGLRGPVSAVVSACASATDAIGAAVDQIRAGRADIMLAGGSEAAITALTMAGFDAAGAMSRRNDDPLTASRPFDVDRDGFVAGEGAAVMVLERAEHAAARGAPVLGHVVGYGATNDAFDPTQPAPGGEGAARAITVALHDADLGVSDIDHVNAHGTSTIPGDVAESQALRHTFGSHRVPVTSNKSSIGHLMGAAGAVEAVATVMTLGTQTIPPTINLATQDPDCDLDIVTRSTTAKLRAALSSSFGFGGHNAVLVFTR